jgi:hypothetical protein
MKNGFKEEMEELTRLKSLWAALAIRVGTLLVQFYSDLASNSLKK